MAAMVEAKAPMDLWAGAAVGDLVADVAELASEGDESMVAFLGEIGCAQRVAHGVAAARAVLAPAMFLLELGMVSDEVLRPLVLALDI
jgi:hypothetical protein